MRLAAIVALAALAGCAGQQQPGELSATAAAGPSDVSAHVPGDYRRTIVRVFKMDHAGASIKDAQISAPVTSFGDIFGGGTVGKVCIRYRMKSSATRGEWTSHTFTEAFGFTKGRLHNVEFRRRGQIALFFCGSDLAYAPFPDINTN